MNGFPLNSKANQYWLSESTGIKKKCLTGPPLRNELLLLMEFETRWYSYLVRKVPWAELTDWPSEGHGRISIHLESQGVWFFFTGNKVDCTGHLGHGAITPEYKSESKTGLIPVKASGFKGYYFWHRRKSDFGVITTGSQFQMRPTSYLCLAHNEPGSWSSSGCVGAAAAHSFGGEISCRGAWTFKHISRIWIEHIRKWGRLPVCNSKTVPDKWTQILPFPIRWLCQGKHAE